MSGNQSVQLPEEEIERCSNCQKPATFNLQKVWVKWKYDPKTGEYSSDYELLDIEPQLNDNLHFCDDCTELWEAGEI